MIQKSLAPRYKDEKSVSLFLSHPNVLTSDGKQWILEIETGMNSVHWDYSLNTNKRDTYGGEVIQILSAAIGDLVIEGECRDYNERELMQKWFKEYMYGLREQNRSAESQPVKIQYPHRGWNWKVYIKEAPDFRMALDVVAPKYKIVCAFYNEGEKDMLHVETMKMFSSSFGSAQLPTFIMKQYSGIYNDPMPMGPGGSIDSITPSQAANTMGDNFQRLVGAWSFGDFAKFSYDALGVDKNANQFSKSTSEYWKALFGTDVLIQGLAENQTGFQGVAGSASGTSGAYTGVWPGDGASDENRALYLGAKARSAGLPDELLVMASLTENSMHSGNGPTHIGRFSDADSVGLFQIRIGSHNPSEIDDAGNVAAYAGWSDIKKAEYWENPENSVKWFVKQAQALRDKGRPYTQSPFNATNLGQWAQAVEISAFPDRYQANYDRATTLLSGLDSYYQAHSTGSGTLGNGVRADLVKVMDWAVSVHNEFRYIHPDPSSGRSNNGYSREGWRVLIPAHGTFKFPRPIGKIIGADCSSSTQMLYTLANTGINIGTSAGYSGATGPQEAWCQANGQVVTPENCKPGDIAFYDGHVNVVHIAGARSGRIEVFNHGSEGEPVIEPYTPKPGRIYNILGNA
jgi:hypothetical protein